MATEANKTKRNLYAAEGVAGTATLAAVGSNRIPEAANAIVRYKRRRDLDKVESKAKTHGLDEKGKWIKLNHLSDDVPEPKVTPLLNDDGTPKTDKAGNPISVKEKVDPISPRVKAANRAMSERVTPAAVHLKAEHNLPFPTSPYKLKPDPEFKGDPKKAPLVKEKTILSSETGRKINTAAHTGRVRRKALLAVGIPLGAAAAWQGFHGAAKQRRILDERRKTGVQKKLDEKDVTAGAIGGAAGLGAYQAPSEMEWMFRGKNDKKIAAKPETRKIIENWKQKNNIRAGEQEGAPIWDKAYRKYPKGLPGWKLRRYMAYTHTGGTGRAAFLGATAGGAAIGVGAHRAYKKKNP